VGFTTSETTRAKAVPAELRGRVVRLVREQEAEPAIRSVAATVGCRAETLRSWPRFDNEGRPHQALDGATPMAVWRRGTSAVDMPLRSTDAGASPPCPPRPRPQAA
jgi:hypothetical protein